MKDIAKECLAAIITTVMLGGIVCGAYPLAVFAIAQGVFPEKANGSIVYYGGAAVGSELIGQAFEDARYIHPRPSATGSGYDGAVSGGSNLGPTSNKLLDTVHERVMQYRAENNLSSNTAVPVDAVMASGSGLDPHITVENAMLQAPRVAKARGWDVAAVYEKIRMHTEGRSLGVFGEPRINVLRLNLALDTEEKLRK